MKARWELILIPSLSVSLLLLVSSQAMFLQASVYRDLGLGRTGEAVELVNYARVFTDSFYLRTLVLTVQVSALATLFTLVLAYPVAYVIARMRSRLAMVLLAAIVISSFITIVIKVFGLIIIFAADGWLNRGLKAVGLVDQPFTIIGRASGIVIGLMHFSLGFAVLLLYGVIRTIPRSLEEAAQIHGASRPRTFLRVVVPLSLPGVVGGGLIVFNLCMGAFTSAAILGGGRVLTLPVLIQRTVMLEVKYAMAGTLAAVLLAAVLLINLASVVALRRVRATRLVIA
jgi:ABC-type spermidine/putrescine transport system permease subunit I